MTTILEKYFAGLAESVFQSRLGVVDPPLTDYVSTLLIRFSKTSQLHSIRALNGRPTTELASMLFEAQQRVGVAKRRVHRHIGDFALFWSGLYPEALRSQKGTSRDDQFEDYCEQGKLAYGIASEIDGEENAPPCQLLKRLSDQFELCAYGLREVRRSWEEESEGDSTLLI